MGLIESYNLIVKSIDGFRQRQSQLDMINLINDCFQNIDPELKDGHNICLIEAPTGTGKSLAYLLSGIINALQNNKKLIIATATKTLQSQLVEQDIPRLIKQSKLNFSFQLAKGRANYVCPYQLDILLAQSDLFQNDNTELNETNKLREMFHDNKWDGDLDSVKLHISSSLKPKLTINKDSCLGYSCQYNQKNDVKCPFYKSKELIKASDVIVTNHSLLLSDLDIGGSVLSIRPEEYYLCIDEGHNFVTNALNSFSNTFNLRDSIDSIEHLAKFIYNTEYKDYILNDIALCENAFQEAHNLINLLGELLQLIELNSNNSNVFVNQRLILNDYLNQQIGTEFKDCFVNIAYVASTLYNLLDKIVNKLKEMIKTTQDNFAETSLNKLGFYISLVESINKTAEYIINKDDSRYNANAKWIDFVEQKNDYEYVINAKFTHIGNLLHNKLWSKVYGAVITSATLAVGNDFNYYLFKLGLSFMPKVRSYKLPSSFDYVTKSQVVVPRFKASPDFATKDEFQNELIAYLEDILDYNESYGTLVLFFNRSQMLDVYNKLSLKLRQRILLQTDFISNQRLINQHKIKINDKKASIIFGLNSFAEGVDLPAKYCMHVVISKLPFDTHTDPVKMVQEYWVKYEKGNYFFDITLPEACIRLIQAAGRLIRDEDDYGQLTICDNRIVTKSYGKILLDSLPNFNRKYNANFLQYAYNKMQV